MDNPKVKIGHNRFGRCLIASLDISKDELVAEFDGIEYRAEKCTDLEKEIADHAIQLEEHKWRDSDGIARLINHSCEPNCGLKGLFTIVAMRDIKAGEELLWDYDMSEDSDWRMGCLCFTPSCRKVIGAFANMPQEVREKYKGYISDWLVKKYSL
jgi:hypothetical protein